MRLIRIVATSLSLYLVTHAFVFTALPVALIISLLDKEKTPALKQWFVRCLFAIVGKRLEVAGTANVEPGGHYVIVANYPSGYAGFALIGTFPQASLVAHAFLERIPLLGQALGRIGAVFVKPGAGAAGQRAIDLYLAKRELPSSIIILPEGGRTPDGRIHRFRRGFVRIQRQTSFDLLPVTLNGLYQFKPMRRFYADPDAQPEMVIHPPLRASIANDMTDDQLIAAVTNTIASAYRP